MKDLIKKEYYKIASDLTISYGVRYADYVKIQMKAECDSTEDEELKRKRSVTCSKVRIGDKIEVSADITLEPEICSLGLDSLDITFQVFGQSYSTMTLKIGISHFFFRVTH